MTQIGIYQIAFEGYVGTTMEERDIPQPLSVDIELTGPMDTISDNLEATIDYDAITQRVLEIGRTSRVNLIETLAERMVQGVLEDHRVESVCLRIKKCQPPRKEIRGGFVITITRQRP